MSSVKVRMTQVIESLPEDASFDEILKELAFERMIQRGLEDVAAGRTISEEEVLRFIQTWPG